jgi:hypothetical protein
MIDENNENKLIEGEDFYYTPEGYKCFTEKHHLKRGYCCKVDVVIVPMVMTRKRKYKKVEIIKSYSVTKSTQQ